MIRIKMMNKLTKKESGFIALTSITIMSAFFIILFVGMFFSATEEMERTDDREDSLKALGAANSCAELALHKLKEDAAYNGNESYTIEDYQCSILDLDAEGYMRVIKAEGEASGKKKRMQVEVDLEFHPELEIMDWREVSNFTEL